MHYSVFSLLMSIFATISCCAVGLYFCTKPKTKVVVKMRTMHDVSPKELQDIFKMLEGYKPTVVSIEGEERKAFLQFLFERDAKMAGVVERLHQDHADVRFRPLMSPELWNYYCNFKPVYENRKHKSI